MIRDDLFKNIESSCNKRGLKKNKTKRVASMRDGYSKTVRVAVIRNDLKNP